METNGAVVTYWFFHQCSDFWEMGRLDQSASIPGENHSIRCVCARQWRSTDNRPCHHNSKSFAMVTTHHAFGQLCYESLEADDRLKSSNPKSNRLHLDNTLVCISIGTRFFLWIFEDNHSSTSDQGNSIKIKSSYTSLQSWMVKLGIFTVGIPHKTITKNYWCIPPRVVSLTFPFDCMMTFACLPVYHVVCHDSSLTDRNWRLVRCVCSLFESHLSSL